MKKISFILLIAIPLFAVSQKGIYDFSIQTNQGTTLNLAEYKGSKILIGVFNTKTCLSNSVLKYLDTLTKLNTNLKVLLVPANDISQLSTDTIVSTTTLASKFSIATATDIVNGKDAQSMLVGWLRRRASNGHFDQNTIIDGQIFIVSESGVLYAVLDRGVEFGTLSSVLRQSDITPGL